LNLFLSAIKNKVNIMRRKISLLIVFIFLVCLFAGCISNTDESYLTQNGYGFPEAYKTVLEKVREAEENAHENAYYDEIYFPQEVFWSSDAKAYYALYDIDNIGMPELFIGNGEISHIWALKGDEASRLFETGFGRRNRCWLLKNGMILNEGSSSASIHAYDFYKMSENGFSVDLENGFVREYPNGAGVQILTITQTNSEGSKEITADEFEAIIKSYTGITAFPFDSDKLDTVNLDWKSVDSFFADDQ